MQDQQAVQTLLNNKLAEIRLRNPAYSLRAFAKKMGLGSAALSEIMNGKRRVSAKLAARIALKLALAPNEIKEILDAFAVSKIQSEAGEVAVQYTQLNMDHYKTISEWFHFAILSLSETQDYKHDAEWIAKRLGIKLVEANQALERLARLEMLSSDADGNLIRGSLKYSTSDDVANIYLRKAHAQNLDLARNSLEDDEVHERDFTAVTMAIDPDRLPAAKKMIREFSDQLCAFMESGKKTQVQKLCIQFIPLTKSGDNK